jgi:hypothetical protein
MDLLALPESGVTTIVVGIIVLILGYLVKFRGWTFLLAGYDPTRITDEDALADLAGGTLLRIGLVIISFGGLAAVGLTSPLIESLVAVAILIAVARLIYRSRRYTA